MWYFKRLKTSRSVSLEAFKMYYVMLASAPSLHRESTNSLITQENMVDLELRLYQVYIVCAPLLM